MLQKVRTIISPPAALKYVTVTVCRIAVLSQLYMQAGKIKGVGILSTRPGQI